MPEAAQSNARTVRGCRIQRNRSVPILLPITYAMLSPIAAPRAARITTTIGFGEPVETPIAAAATTTVSLGTGGKKPSRITIAKITAYTHGDITVERRASVRNSMTTVSITAPQKRGTVFEATKTQK